MNLYTATCTLGILLATPFAAYSHGGGLDAEGCHHNRQAGGYHCHRGPLAGQSFRSKQDATRALQGDGDQDIRPSGRRIIVGKARIIDGDTIEIAGRQIRLYGIDAPETGQFCEAGGRKWACGQNAAFGLSAIVERQWVHCLPKSSDSRGRIIAVCRLAGADGPDINAAMVRQGWAEADRQPPAPYLAEEKAARAAKAGIWVGR